MASGTSGLTEALLRSGGLLHPRSFDSSLDEQLTFEPGYGGPARFTRDGNTVGYSAAWNGEPRQLYMQRSNSVQATPRNLDADVLGIADNLGFLVESWKRDR